MQREKEPIDENMIEKNEIWIAKPDSRTPKNTFEIFTKKPDLIELQDVAKIWASDKTTYFINNLEGIAPVYESLESMKPYRAELSIDTDTADCNCYIARNMNNNLYVFKEAPYKSYDGVWLSDSLDFNDIDERWCRNVQWKDREPTPARIEIKLIDE